MFYYFSKMAPTGYSLTVKLDVTELWGMTHQKNIKFFPAYLWPVTKNINRQIDFKIAERDGVLGYYDQLAPLYASFHDDGHTFSLMWTPFSDQFSVFYRQYLENQLWKINIHRNEVSYNLLREIQEEDISLCGEIYVKAFPKEHWGVDWSVERACEYLQDYMEQKRFVGYVYEEAGAVQGAIFACGKISGCHEEIHINEMMVLPSMQGKGIGKTLLKAIQSYSEQHKFAGVVLYTSEYAPAEKFYEKNGFQISKGVVCMFFQHES